MEFIKGEELYVEKTIIDAKTQINQYQYLKYVGKT
jgi:hypothetical protein